MVHGDFFTKRAYVVTFVLGVDTRHINRSLFRFNKTGEDKACYDNKSKNDYHKDKDEEVFIRKNGLEIGAAVKGIYDGVYKASRKEGENKTESNHYYGVTCDRNPLVSAGGVLSANGGTGISHKLTDPLCPVEQGSSRTEGEKENKDNVSCINKGLKCAPLGNEHSEGCEIHSCDTNHHSGSKGGISLDKTVHILDVTTAGGVLNRTNGLEEEGLGYAVEHHKEDCGPNGFVDAYTAAGNDKTEVGNGGVCKNLFTVGVDDCTDRCNEEGESADKSNGKTNHIACHCRSKTDEQIDTGLNHGCTVEKGGGGCGSHHCAHKPTGEGKLCRFGKSGKSKEDKGNNHTCFFGSNNVLKVCNVHFHSGITNSNCKSYATKKVHPKGAEGVVYSLLGSGVADKEEGNNRGDFPEEIHPDKVCREDDTKHCTKENKEHRTEEGTSVFNLAAVVMVVVFKVAYCINADETAYNSNHKAEDKGKVIAEKIIVYCVGVTRKFKPSYKAGLNCRKETRIVFFILDAEVDDDSHKDEFNSQHTVVYGADNIEPAQSEIVGNEVLLFAEIHNSKHNGCQDDCGTAYVHGYFAKTIILHKGLYKGSQEGEEN